MIRRAFTIIELLLVILVITILAAILFPVVANAKSQGNLTTALSQFKELGTAATLYANDADGKMVPSTNYGAPEARPERLWPPQLKKYAKSEAIFVAPGSDGRFADAWSDRGWATVGMNSAAAYKKNGCSEDQKDTTGCEGFDEVASFDSTDQPAAVGLFASTPGGDVEKHYEGYEFSPYSGIPTGGDKKLIPPMASDQDIVKAMGDIPTELLKPIYARYVADGKDDGKTPVVFADGHVKSFSAKQIQGAKTGIVWRFR